LWLANIRDAMLDHHRRRLALAHPHRQQLDPWLLLPKSSCQVKTAPAKNLIGVHTVFPRHLRYRRAGHQCLFHDPPTFGYLSLLVSL